MIENLIEQPFVRDIQQPIELSLQLDNREQHLLDKEIHLRLDIGLKFLIDKEEMQDNEENSALDTELLSHILIDKGEILRLDRPVPNDRDPQAQIGSDRDRIEARDRGDLGGEPESEIDGHRFSGIDKEDK